MIGSLTFRCFEHVGPRPGDALADVRRWLRVFFVGGSIAYRGLFNWIRPAIYIPTMLGAPLFQLIFFTKLGQFAHAENRDFYIVGNSIQACAMSSVYGMTMAVANERWFGTLGPLLASPANRSAVFLGRGVPVLANGLLRLDVQLRRRARAPRLPARARLGPVARAGRSRDGALVHRVRDAARLDRAAREGLLLRREPRLLPDAPLLRRQHPARHAAGLDERDRPLPAADARDRRRARGGRAARPSATSAGSSGRSSGSPPPTRSPGSCSSGCSSTSRAGPPFSTRTRRPRGRIPVSGEGVEALRGRYRGGMRPSQTLSADP